MAPEMPELREVVERLEKLERQNRWLKQAAPLVALAALCGLLMAQTPGHRTVEANEFVLKDADGTARGRWSVGAYGPGFVLLDANGKNRVALDVLDPAGAGLTLSDASGRQRTHLVATVNGPGLHLTDANGKDRVLVTADDTEDSAGLFLYDKKGNQPVRLSVGPGRAHLILFPPGEAPTDRLIYLVAGPGLGPQVTVKDKEGFYTSIGTTDLRSPRTGATGKTSAASVMLFDKDNNVLWQAP
jgi:hypothetical protein